MPYHDKGTKAKTLATASTLQKVVCPAQEMDPQEILSNGWRKVGEQKRYTNRLTYGNPNLGYKLSIHERAKLPSQPTGRQVIERMFGHLRPHRNITSAGLAKLKAEEAELENGLGTQGARAAYYRPSIVAALKPLPPEFSLPDSSGAATERPAQRHLHFANIDDPDKIDGYGESCALDGPSLGEGESRDVRPSPRGSPMSSPGASPPLSLLQRPVGGASLTRHGSNGQDSGRETRFNGSERVGALPAVVLRARASVDGAMGYSPSSHQYQQHFQLAQVRDKGSQRFPAASAPHMPYIKRRASISGDLPLPAITVTSYSSGSVTAAGAKRRSCSGGGSGGPPATARHVVLTLGIGSSVSDGAGADVSTSPFEQNLVLPVPRSKLDRNSFSGAVGPGSSSAAVVIAGSASSMPHLGHRPIMVTGGSGSATGSSMSADDIGIRMSGSGCGRVEPLPQPPQPLVDSPRGIRSPRPALANTSDGTAAAGTLTGAASGSGRTTAAGESTSGGEGGCSGNGGNSASGGASTSTSTPGPSGSQSGVASQVSGSGVLLSGLENLSSTGLAEAIEQLRNIRARASVAQPKEPRERKQEPGLAGVMSVQLLPVPLPPLENWYTTGKLTADLDPCRGIRLVDTANYVLPKQQVENSLQHRMAQHQAAMVQLVKAEGRPMSESEMEAVRLLGRLERSGARQRNLVDSEGEVDADAGDAER